MMPNENYNYVTHEGRRVYQHHLILPKKKGYDVDHINGDKKDNRPENLRYLPRRLNAVHRFRRGAGVDWLTRLRKWRARFAGQHLGVFKTKSEAIAARTAALTAAFTRYSI